MGRGLGDNYARADFGVEHFGIKLAGDFAGELQHLAVESEPLVVLVEEYAQHPKVGIVIFFHCIYGVPNLGNTQKAQYLRGHRNNQRAGGHIGVDGEDV